MILPASWAALLELFRPAFRRRGTFTLFTVLATGMVARNGRRTVVGMLSGARMAGAVSFHAACRFFSQGGQGHRQPGRTGRQLLVLIATEFPDRLVHGVGDAAYHGKPLLVGADHVDDPVADQRRAVGPGSPAYRQARAARAQGRLGTPTAVTEHADWEKATVVRYGRTESVLLAEVPCIWYGSFGNAVGRCVLVREQGSAKSYELALFTLDTTATAAGVVQRHAVRWSIEPSNATSKQQTGVGQARNRVPRAVERTVPFGMLVQTPVIVWYALHGHHPDDVLARRLAEPWYDSKTEPSFEDMIANLPRTLITARFTIVPPGQVDPDLLRDYSLACAAAAT